jgi:putative nucleotidyltransferase with HDIG domain
MEISLSKIKEDSRVKEYLKYADKQMEAIGYTEHGFRHAEIVSSLAGKILNNLGYSKREVELARIAGYLHDIGNVISRESHPQIGAILSLQILEKYNFPVEDIALIVSAIGNHEEDTGDVVNVISAAQILADKADVHFSRVRNPNTLAFDIHDRVNYAARKSNIIVDKLGKTITLKLEINTKISQVMEYFEIFLERMIISRKAAQFLGCEFRLKINNIRLL